jgi:hypothetical protein
MARLVFFLRTARVLPLFLLDEKREKRRLQTQRNEKKSNALQPGSKETPKQERKLRTTPKRKRKGLKRVVDKTPNDRHITKQNKTIHLKRRLSYF